MIPLSVLDLSFVTSGGSGPAALQATVDLARHVDALGYTRFWVAEHHNLPSIASAAPEVMIARIASATARIRVGSGGVMLPNHAPILVVERFKLLEGLFPGRIDLGIGRAPGTDQLTAIAIRRHQTDDVDGDLLERLDELMRWDTNGFPASHPFSRIRVMPADVALPPIHLLGSSGFSARVAAAQGLGFAFAHHFAMHDPLDAMLAYRAGFKPSAAFPRPHAILAVAVVAAETDAEAERLASSVDLMWLRRNKGEFGPLASPEEAAAYPYTPADREMIRRQRARLFVGSPATVYGRLAPLAEATGADELMIVSAIHDQDARRRSYTLMAKAPAAASAA